MTPHLGIGQAFDFSWGTVEPFVSCDYVMNFEDAFSEKGKWNYRSMVITDTTIVDLQTMLGVDGPALLAMHQKERDSSMLRSEAGMKLYIDYNLDWATLLFVPRASYINKKPFNVGKIEASIVGNTSTFDSLEDVQNIAAGGLDIFFETHSNGIFGQISYDGEFGTQYTSQELRFEIGIDF